MVKDHPDRRPDDAEEVVLSRWGKIKQWFEIAMATKKLAMFVWSLIFGTAGTVLYGEVTDTKPLHNAAVEIGLVDRPFAPSEFVGHTHNFEHTHDWVVPTHTHEGLGKEHKHADHVHADHTHPELEALPENHEALH